MFNVNSSTVVVTINSTSQKDTLPLFGDFDLDGHIQSDLSRSIGKNQLSVFVFVITSACDPRACLQTSYIEVRRPELVRLARQQAQQRATVSVRQPAKCMLCLSEIVQIIALLFTVFCADFRFKSAPKHRMNLNTFGSKQSSGLHLSKETTNRLAELGHLSWTNFYIPHHRRSQFTTVAIQASLSQSKSYVFQQEAQNKLGLRPGR